MAPFGAPEPAVEVPGFGKNSNIHELFGKMIWRKMEQIQDAAVVDQLQNRIMNLIHDALAGQSEKQQQQRKIFSSRYQYIKYVLRILQPEGDAVRNAN